MTALKQYSRLEATGLWRATPEDQRREVIVSVGEATLTICDLNDRALAHWSLAAIDRLNPGALPALYCPDGDPGETLELAAGETDMIRAIEKLRQAIDRARPHPGRLRLVSVLASIAVVLAVLGLWLPGALLRHTVAVLPEITRQEIGGNLLGRIERLTGAACSAPDTAAARARLARRTGMRELAVLGSGLSGALLLPGGIVLLDSALIEEYEDPAVAAGFIIAERARAARRDPLAALLADTGPLASFRLLTTGRLTPEILDRYAERVLTAPRPELPDDAALAAFAQAGIPSAPYAYALDGSGETVLALIEADPMTGTSPEPLLPDRDWVRLQNICGG